MRHQFQYLDTNVVVRYLLGDVSVLQKKAEEIFRSAENGEIRLTLNAVVVAELVFVLESYYKKSREDIVLPLKVLISQRWIHVPEREVLNSAWATYMSGLHFVDAYLLACAKVNQGVVASFDKELLKNQV